MNIFSLRHQIYKCTRFATLVNEYENKQTKPDLILASMEANLLFVNSLPVHHLNPPV